MREWGREEREMKGKKYKERQTHTHTQYNIHYMYNTGQQTLLYYQFHVRVR